MDDHLSVPTLLAFWREHRGFAQAGLVKDLDVSAWCTSGRIDAEFSPDVGELHSIGETANRTAFQAYIEQVLVPTLRGG